MKNDTLIIIPAYNEAENIEKVLDSLRVQSCMADVLVVNDGSVDQTGEILEKRGVFFLHHLMNMGIGVSFETGCQFAVAHGYKWILRMDGDGQHDNRYINDLLLPVKTGEVDIAIGSRFLGDANRKTSVPRLLGIKIISFILLIMTHRTVTDPTSGFVAMNRKAFEFFAENCVDDYPEPEIILHHHEFRIREIPINVNKRQGGTSSITPLKSVYYMVKVVFSLVVKLFR